MKEDKDFLELILASEVDECLSYTEIYWKMLALKKRKAWLLGAWRFPFLGSDEYWRRTLVIGPFVFALWVTSEGKLIHKKLEEKLNLMMKNDLLK